MGYHRGMQAEVAASDYLRKKGMQIVERNFRTRAGEIDIIARQNGVVIFVEVRARRIGGLVDPLESITPTKRSRLLKAIRFFVATRHVTSDCRVDVVAILWDRAGRIVQVDHIEDAFPLG